METQTQPEFAAPPGNGGGIAVACPGDFEDNIREIGDQIANLTLLQARDLANYLKYTYGIGEKLGIGFV